MLPGRRPPLRPHSSKEKVTGIGVGPMLIGRRPPLRPHNSEEKVTGIGVGGKIDTREAGEARRVTLPVLPSYFLTYILRLP